MPKADKLLEGMGPMAAPIKPVWELNKQLGLKIEKQLGNFDDRDLHDPHRHPHVVALLKDVVDLADRLKHEAQKALGQVEKM